MLPVFFGLFFATMFGILSHAVYDTAGMMAHAWIDIVFWSLIGTGALVSFVNMLSECLPCRLVRMVHAENLEDRLCKDLTCV
jgi:hypothetical protein